MVEERRGGGGGGGGEEEAFYLLEKAGIAYGHAALWVGGWVGGSSR